MIRRNFDITLSMNGCAHLPVRTLLPHPPAASRRCRDLTEGAMWGYVTEQGRIDGTMEIYHVNAATMKRLKMKRR